MTSETPPPPNPTITPHLAVGDVGAALDFYARAFGAEELVRLTGPGGAALHGEMLVGGALITLGAPEAAPDTAPPDPAGPAQVTITWFGPDVDAALDRAVAAGATLASPAADQFHGDRVGIVRCPFGHRWVLGTHLEDVGYAEQQRRLDELMAGMV
jgi:PhnB protein